MNSKDRQRRVIEALDAMITDDEEIYPTVREEDPNGTIRWTMNGMDHRLDGPAIISRSGQIWCQVGELHREDGPAVIWYDGECEWHVQGDPIGSYEEFQDATGCSDENLVALKLKYGDIR